MQITIKGTDKMTIYTKYYPILWH